MKVQDVMKQARFLGACEKSGKATTWKSLAWLLFSPQGREFCLNNKFPSLQMFREIKDHMKPYRVYVEENAVYCNQDVAIIGGGATLVFDKMRNFKVILMHGAIVNIEVSNHAVVLVESVDSEYIITNDGTGVIL